MLLVTCALSLLFSLLLVGQETGTLRDLISRWNSISDKLYWLPVEKWPPECRERIDEIDREVDEINFYAVELNTGAQTNYKEADLIDWIREVIAKGELALKACQSSL